MSPPPANPSFRTGLPGEVIGSARTADGPVPAVHQQLETELPGWRAIALVETVNFATLRRQLGCARADQLAGDIVERIGSVLPRAGLAPIGRGMVEASFAAEDLHAIGEALDGIDAAFSSRIELEGEPHIVKVRIAAAAAPSALADDIRLAEEAETALASARAERRAVLIDLSDPGHAVDRLSLMRDLRRGIEREELFLQYQPKAHLRRQAITSVEALVRWQHPTRGPILPGDFIGAAEEASVIAGLTLWTLRRVIADQKRMAAAGHDIPVFINISGQLLADRGFVAEACALASGGGAKIGFEITETSVIRDPASAIRHLHTFAEIGIELAIDDYGAGLSSLAYLKQLPARELKIDRMFVTQLTSSNRDPLIVRSTIDLAHALEMEVTAEGVETPAALALLSVMGCDMVQGYLISRPIGIEALIRFLQETPFLDHLANPRELFRPAALWKVG